MSNNCKGEPMIDKYDCFDCGQYSEGDMIKIYGSKTEFFCNKCIRKFF